MKQWRSQCIRSRQVILSYCEEKSWYRSTQLAFKSTTCIFVYIYNCNFSFFFFLLAYCLLHGNSYVFARFSILFSSPRIIWFKCNLCNIFLFIFLISFILYSVLANNIFIFHWFLVLIFSMQSEYLFHMHAYYYYLDEWSVFNYNDGNQSVWYYVLDKKLMDTKYAVHKSTSLVKLIQDFGHLHTENCHRWFSKVETNLEMKAVS